MAALKIRPGAARGLVADPSDTPQQDSMARVVTFDAEQLTETDLALQDITAPDPADPKVTWVRIMATPGSGSLAAFGARWGLNPLELEDVVNLGHRPKTNLGDGAAFTVLQIPAIDDSGSLGLRQVSLFLGANYVISIVQDGDPVFDLVAERLRTGGVTGRIRRYGAEYLFYALITATVDHAFPVMDSLGKTVDRLEEGLLEDQDQEPMDPIHRLRRELNALRRSQRPAREAIERLIRSQDSPLSKKARTLMRDSLEHQVQINEQIDGLKEDVMGLQDLHLSLQGHRLNEVMRVLTIIATIFIPLSFFTGLYGMNFDPDASPWNMPELDARYGYPLLLTFLVSLVIGMIVFFKRRKWL